MRTLLAMFLAAALGACVHDPEPIAIAAAPVVPAPSAPPPPKMVYEKQGAGTEEFQRTKAACQVRAAAFDVFNELRIFRLCMRAEGWVLVPVRQ